MLVRHTREKRASRRGGEGKRVHARARERERERFCDKESDFHERKVKKATDILVLADAVDN
jgi:hypothetical protein